MVLGVAEDDVARAGQGGDGGQVGGEARGKEEHGLRVFKLRQALFQPLVRRRAAGDQRTGPAAQAFRAEGGGSGRPQPRIARQGQVVVRSEVDQFPRVKDDLRRLGPFAGGQAAAKTNLFQGGKFVGDPGKHQ